APLREAPRPRERHGRNRLRPRATRREPGDRVGEARGARARRTPGEQAIVDAAGPAVEEKERARAKEESETLVGLDVRGLRHRRPIGDVPRDDLPEFLRRIAR